MRKEKTLVLEIRLREKENSKEELYLYTVFPYPKMAEPFVYINKERKIVLDRNYNKEVNFLDQFDFFSREEIIDMLERWIKKGSLVLFSKDYDILEKKLYEFENYENYKNKYTEINQI